MLTSSSSSSSDELWWVSLHSVCSPSCTHSMSTSGSIITSVSISSQRFNHAVSELPFRVTCTFCGCLPISVNLPSISQMSTEHPTTVILSSIECTRGHTYDLSFPFHQLHSQILLLRSFQWLNECENPGKLRGSLVKLAWSRVFTTVVKISLASCNVEKNSALVLFPLFLANFPANSHPI